MDTSEEIMARRREVKALREKYRQAAGRLYGVKISPVAHVQPQPDGAFVEIVVWVPLGEAEKETL